MRFQFTLRYVCIIDFCVLKQKIQKYHANYLIFTSVVGYMSMLFVIYFRNLYLTTSFIVNLPNKIWVYVTIFQYSLYNKYSNSTIVYTNIYKIMYSFVYKLTVTGRARCVHRCVQRNEALKSICDLINAKSSCAPRLARTG